MSLAIKEFFYQEGKNRQEAEKALNHIFQQLREIDEKLKERTDMEIWHRFQEEQHVIKQHEININRLLHYK